MSKNKKSTTYFDAHPKLKWRLLDKNVLIQDFIFNKKINVAGTRGNIDSTNNRLENFSPIHMHSVWSEKKLYLVCSVSLSFLNWSNSLHSISLCCLSFFFLAFFTPAFFTAHIIPMENTLLTITALKCSTSRSLDHRFIRYIFFIAFYRIRNTNNVWPGIRLHGLILGLSFFTHWTFSTTMPSNKCRHKMENNERINEKRYIADKYVAYMYF